MKRLLTLIISATLVLTHLYSQTAPIGINYQAVARNNFGIELANQSLTVRFSILETSPAGTLEWEETQNAQTNQFGLFTLTIGQTTYKTGGTALNFDSIKWGSGAHYLKVEVDFGSGFVSMGTTQMLAVPYALYAKNAGNGGGGSATQITYDAVTHKLYANSKEIADFSGIGANAVQNINLNGNMLTYSQSGQDHTIDFSKYLDNTDRQNLSIKGHTLTIENGNYITLPDSVNEPQTLTLQGNKLRLLLGAKEYGSAIVDTDSTNEIQDIYEENNQIYLTKKVLPRKIDLSQNLAVDKKNNTLTIKRGNTIPIDADTTNEIQQLSYKANYISLNKNGGSVYDADTSKTNELITKTEFDGDNLKITEAGTVHSTDLTSLKNVPWVGFNCQKNSEVIVPKQSSGPGIYDIQWDQVDCLNSDATFQSAIQFVVPSSGVYQISLSLIFNNPINVQLIRGTNEILQEYLPYFGSFLSTTILLNLYQNDKISIRIINTSVLDDIKFRKGNFAAYRVH